MRRFALIAFAFGLMTASPLLAAGQSQEKDDVCAVLDSIPMEKLREDFKHYKNPEEKIKMLLEGRAREEGCRLTYWRDFKAKPAREVIGAEGFGTYQKALDQSDCDTAFALLINAFPAAHPRAPDILEDDVHRLSWEAGILAKYYPELGFCRDLRKLREARAEIERRGIAAERYRSALDITRIDELPQPVVSRNFALSSLIHLDDYAPALLALARLSHEGEVIRYVPAYQYFLLQKALVKGVARDELAAMFSVVEARLPPSQIEDLKRQARAGEYKGPEPITE